jgi:hypothetical protein
MTEYRFTQGGTTRGAVTRSVYVLRPDGVVVAPDGEFKHLPNAMYTTRDMQPASASRYEVREGAAGWWKVINTETGEPVEGESARSEGEAQANAKRLNRQ